MKVASKEFYLARNGEKFGPYSGRALRAMGMAGEITSNMKIWSEGMADWVPVGAVKGLDVRPESPPPPPAAPTAGHVTIEKTSKQIKKLQLINWVVFAAGLLLYLVGIAAMEPGAPRSDNAASLSVGLIGANAVFGSICFGIGLRIYRWWNHG